MRILFSEFSLPYLLSDADYPVGGWAVEMNQWLNALTDAGHTAGVITWNGANAHVGRSLPFELIETFDPNKGVRILKYVYDYIPAMMAAARRFKPDVLVQGCRSTHTGMMAFVGGRLGVPFAYRAVSDADVPTVKTEQLTVLDQKAYEYGLRNAAKIICQNEAQRSGFAQWAPAKPVEIIYNPVGPRLDAPPIPSRSDRGYVAWLGVFRWPKNLPLLYRIANALPDVAFRVAGMPARDMDAETAAALAALQGLANVHFVGYLGRGAVPDFLAHAVALLSTSHHEGFSNTFLEAFSVGTPVVCPRRVDPDLIVTRNELGWTADADGDLPSLLARIIALDKAAFDKIRLRAQRYVASEHAPAAQAAKLVLALERAR